MHIAADTESSRISEFMNMFRAQSESKADSDIELAKAKLNAKSDIEWARSKGLISRASAQGTVKPGRKQKTSAINQGVTTEEIKRKVAIYEKVKAQGLTHKQALLQAGIPAGTIYRWLKITNGEIEHLGPTYTDAQIKAHLATFEQLRDDGLSIAESCKAIGVSTTAIRKWSGKDKL
jgi:hypothetical protein